MRSVRVAVEVGREQIAIAILAREAPELRLERLLGRSGEIDLLRQQGLVGGNLLSAGGGEHIVANGDHHAGDVGVRSREMSKERGGEGAVPALAVESNVVGLRCERDEEAGKSSDTSEPRRRQGEPGAGEGIVAAGVEKNEMASLSFAEFGQHRVKRDRPRFDVAQRVQLRADGDEIVAAAELEAVAGIVEQRKVPRGRLSREFLDRTLHGGQVEIGLGRDHEPERLQGRRDVLRVVRGIGERRGVSVGAVADDKSVSALGARRHGGEREEAAERRYGVRAETEAPLNPYCFTAKNRHPLFASRTKDRRSSQAHRSRRSTCLRPNSPLSRLVAPVARSSDRTREISL